MNRDIESHIDNLFPYRGKNGKASYRLGQKEAITKAIEALVVQDYDIFFVDAPVGFGKSGTLATIARFFSSMDKYSYYTTPQKILQDQLSVEFKDIPQIKGRNNYICAEDAEVSCADGACQTNDKYNCEMKNFCPYLLQRNLCVDSYICGMNTSYMMTVRRSIFEDRDLLICDEAHSVPEWGVGFVSVTLRELDIGIIPIFEAGFKAYILWLSKMILPMFKEKEIRLSEMVKGFGKTKRKAALGMIDAYKNVKDCIKKIEMIMLDYEKFGEDWLYNIVEDHNGKKIVFMPLTSGRFLNNLLWSRGSKLVFSSGTITPSVYIYEAGLDKFEFNLEDCVISVPSEFPPEKSPIYYKSVGKMTNSNKGYTFPLVMKELNKLIKERCDRKGILHTFSYSNAEYIINNIDPELRSMLWVQDRRNREKSLEEWISCDKPSVFISTNMTEGLNLKDDLCRYQVYVKIGFPNTQDKRVAKRLDLGHWVWYYLQAIEDLEQASGRATRSKDDSSEMFIYDSSFANIITKYGKFLKPWFKDRLIFVPNY